MHKCLHTCSLWICFVKIDMLFFSTGFHHYNPIETPWAPWGNAIEIHWCSHQVKHCSLLSSEACDAEEPLGSWRFLGVENPWEIR